MCFSWKLTPRKEFVYFGRDDWYEEKIHSDAQLLELHVRGLHLVEHAEATVGVREQAVVSGQRLEVDQETPVHCAAT